MSKQDTLCRNLIENIKICFNNCYLIVLPDKLAITDISIKKAASSKLAAFLS